MFDGFVGQEIATDRGVVFARVGGSGPPLLLLHGYPQTHRRSTGTCEVWRPWARDVTGHGLQASHFLVEDRPEEVADELTAFLKHASTQITRAPNQSGALTHVHRCHDEPAAA
jgi:pimeloyl-ACP methyl ester carboxylesterase